MRLVAIGMLVMAVSAGAAIDAQGHPSGSLRESFARLKQAVRSEDPHGFCELIFPYGRGLPISGLEKQLRALRTKKGRARYEKYVEFCAHKTSRATVAEWKPLLRGLTIVSVRTHGDMATARTRTRTGRIIRLKFVDAAGEWRLLFRFA